VEWGRRPAEGRKGGPRIEKKVFAPAEGTLILMDRIIGEKEPWGRKRGKKDSTGGSEDVVEKGGEGEGGAGGVTSEKAPGGEQSKPVRKQ